MFSRLFRTALPSLLLATTIVATTLASSALHAAEPSNQADNMLAYAELVRAQADYERALGEAQYNYAKAELTRAQAAGAWQEARRLQLIVNSLALRLRQQAREQARLRVRIERIEDKVRGANQILVGNVNARALQSLRYLQIQVVGPTATLAAMTLPVNFIAEEGLTKSSSTSEIVPFSGGNLGQLIHHLTSKRLGLAPWGEGHLVLVQGLEIMTESVMERLSELDLRRRELVDPTNLPDAVKVVTE